MPRDAGVGEDVDRDRQRRVQVAGQRGGVAHPHLRGALLVGQGRQLVGDRVRDHGRVVARLEDRLAHDVELVGALARRAQLRVAVVDRRLRPDEDPRLVEAVQQALVEQVVRARDVRPERLELVDGVVDVGVGQCRASTRDVLLHRGAAQVDHAVVEAQHAVDDRDAAQADPAPVDLHHPAARAGGDRCRVEVRAVGGPQFRRPANRHREAHSHALAGLQLTGGDAALGHGAVARMQPHGHRRRLQRGAGVLEPAVDEHVPPARGPHADASRQQSRVVHHDRAARDERHRSRDPAPVPPALAQLRAAPVVDADDECVGLTLA